MMKMRSWTVCSIIRKCAVLVVLLLCLSLSCHAHRSFVLHCEDIMAVLGFEYNTKLFNRSKDKSNQSWTKFISSDMIDNTDSDFFKQLKIDYPGLNIHTPNNHRLLFHWAYEAKPWTPELERFVREYCERTGRDANATMGELLEKLRIEQGRRNRLIIEKTKQVFGIQNKVYIHFLASMAYNVHILGDYVSVDNTVLNGLYEFDKLVGQFVVELRRLDYANSKEIVRGITKINSRNNDVQRKADELMEYLKLHVPDFVKKANDGKLKKQLEEKGFIIK